VTKPKKGDTGTSLWQRKDSAWWEVKSEDSDRETGWRDGAWGAYIPAENIIASDPQVFPDYELEDGAIVRITVELVRP